MNKKNSELSVTFNNHEYEKKLANLIESVIETLIEVLQVQKHHCLTGLHTHLDPVDVSTHL